MLDVGCGIRPHTVTGAQRYVGVDAHQPYLDAFPLDFAGELICAEWRDALELFGLEEFDLLLALDFIEHLDREEGLDFLAEADWVARNILIFTPLGAFPQEYGDGESDQWGMGGGRWQCHRSAWTPADFPGWRIAVLDGYHQTDAKGVRLPAPIGAFWALKEAN